MWRCWTYSRSWSCTPGVHQFRSIWTYCKLLSLPFQGVCTWMGTLRSSLQGRYTLPPLKIFRWPLQLTAQTTGELLYHFLVFWYVFSLHCKFLKKNLRFFSTLNGVSGDPDVDTTDSVDPVDLLECTEVAGDGASTPTHSVGNCTASISASGASSNATSGAVSPHDGSIPLDQLKQLLSSQLEYYFSRLVLLQSEWLWLK